MINVCQLFWWAIDTSMLKAQKVPRHWNGKEAITTGNDLFWSNYKSFENQFKGCSIPAPPNDKDLDMSTELQCYSYWVCNLYGFYKRYKCNYINLPRTFFDQKVYVVLVWRIWKAFFSLNVTLPKKFSRLKTIHAPLWLYDSQLQVILQPYLFVNMKFISFHIR